MMDAKAYSIPPSSAQSSGTALTNSGMAHTDQGWLYLPELVSAVLVRDREHICGFRVGFVAFAADASVLEPVCHGLYPG